MSFDLGMTYLTKSRLTGRIIGKTDHVLKVVLTGTNGSSHERFYTIEGKMVGTVLDDHSLIERTGFLFGLT